MGAWEDAASRLKALAHPARLQILSLLRDGEVCVCEMEAQLGYRQAYISQHLMALREAGLVSVRRDGWRVFYRVLTPSVYALMELAAEMCAEEPVAARIA